jgi:hypothetical protein
MESSNGRKGEYKGENGASTPAKKDLFEAMKDTFCIFWLQYKDTIDHEFHELVCQHFFDC